MSWKALEGAAENFNRAQATGITCAMPATYRLRFLLDPEAPAELNAAAVEESDAAIKAAVDDWKAKSEHAARRLRLEQDRFAAVKKAERLKEQAARVGRDVEDAIYHGRPVDAMEKDLERFGRESATAESRVPILDKLIGQAKADETKELRAVVETARLQEVSRLDAAIAKAADDLAGAAESFGGQWYIVSEARTRLQYAAVVADRFADAAA
jgi:hypothetical protein